MAAIDTLTGVTEISHNLYEVTSVVDIGSGIDDVADSTFIMKDGGLLRWTNGCSTTFTRCIFVETATCQHLGFDNFNDTTDDFINDQGRPRFFSTVSNSFDVTPVFEGCAWHCYLGKRSDFDVMYAGSTLKASPIFRKDQYGNYCKITIERDPSASSFAQFNHFASDTITIDGLIVDHKIAASGAFEFARIPNDTDQMKDLIILDNHLGDAARHTVLLGYNVPDGTSKTLKGLGARNIALFSGGFDYTLRLVDPVGLLRKADDATESNDGRLQGFRTFSGTFLNATTQAAVDNIRATYYTRTNSSDVLLDSKQVGDYSVELQAYEEFYDSNVLDTSMNDYTEQFCGYGFLTQKTDITVSTDTTNTSLYQRGNILLFENLDVVNPQVTAEAWTDVTDAQEVYDAFEWLSVSRDDDVAYVGTSPVTRSGSELDFGSYDVVIDPTLDMPYAVFSNPADQTHPAGATGTYTIGINYIPSSPITNHIELTETALNATTASTGSGDWRCSDITFGNGGTKAYFATFRTGSDGSNGYMQYSLSTPYDLDTATYDGSYNPGFSVNGQESSLKFSPDGTKAYRFSRWSNWYQFDLTTPWDLTGTVTRTTISQPNDRHAAAAFNADGTKVFALRDSRSYWQNEIHEHTLSTAWDLTTMNADWQATVYNFDDIGGWDASADSTGIYKNDIQFVDDGNKLFLYNGCTKLWFWFELDSPYTITPGTLTTDAYYVVPFGSVTNYDNGVLFVPEVSRVYSVDPRQLASGDSLFVRSQPMNVVQSYAGAANTAYIKASTIAAANGLSTMRTTGYITLQNGAGTGLQLVDANGVQTNVTISGINPDTEVRMYRVSDDTEVAGIENSIGSSASLNYTFVTPEDMYIVVHNETYTTSPRYIPFTTQSAPATLAVFQSIDRAFNNPA